MTSAPTDSVNTLIEFLASLEGLGRRGLRAVAESLLGWEHFLSFRPEELTGRFAFLPSAARDALAAGRRRAGDFRPNPHYISFRDAAYPARFQALYDPPSGFYFRGDRELLDQACPWIAVVGTRRASPYALNHCQHLVAGMRKYGAVIVSGLALGIDGMAHRAALAAGMKTVAVLGTGVERIYPTRHRGLASDVLQTGLLLSELAPGTPIAAWHFPQRNRLIAALSDAVVVVEAPEKSGALLTADFALDLGKEIYVVPGPADSGRNRGGHRLIQQGAKLLLDGEEIFRDLGYFAAEAGPISTGSDAPGAGPDSGPHRDSERKLLEIIGFEARHIDKIIDMSHLPSPRVTALLMQLMLRGMVTELPGHYFALSPFSREWLSISES